MSKSGGNGEDMRDALVKDYGTALRESALLTTFSGLLFGFLLNISITSVKQFAFPYKIIILIAFSQIINDYAYLVAIIPFLLVVVLFQMRKLG
jgi:hypothetical protein